ncbi:hypothetical protein IFM89_034066 [Coptis chinensis]|uniref:Protein kinase domain-containing protein n=1 Tax=Coptis chinensis TaxID=261450 RepID=A0A835IRL3_9MAGN|nr:hypothetical protein IFM89_034066 [Coptis chinensis]
MTVEEEIIEKKVVMEKKTKKKNVLVGIRLDHNDRLLLNWTLVRVAEPGDQVVALHVCQDLASNKSSLLDDYLEVYKGLCNVKQLNLTGKLSCGRSIRKTVAKEAKLCDAMVVVVGISSQNALRGWVSVANYCAKRLPLTTIVLAVHDGKVIFQRGFTNELPGIKGDWARSLYPIKPQCTKRNQSSPVVSESPSFASSETKVVQNIIVGSRDGVDETKHDNFHTYKYIDEVSLCSTPGGDDTRDAESSVVCEDREESPSNSIDELVKEIAEPRPGWPLLKRASSVTQVTVKESTARDMSVVHWAMSLPKRINYPSITQDESDFGSDKTEVLLEKEIVGVSHKSSKSSLSAWGELPKELELLLRTNSSRCRWFSHKELMEATSQFSSGLISLNNAGRKEKCGLSWELRFNLAIGVAEAINYLHKECSRAVIHRDIKSSNILLSDEFEPRISDFGLAIWASTSSSEAHSDVVGTFGYLAPEYFMYGKISEKIDVYSFGVVLLELLSGKKPISTGTLKGQESLVMWAKPILESGDAMALLDPNLSGKVNEVQMERLIRAANLCITRNARLRPEMDQILKLLRGVEDIEEWANSQAKDQEECEIQEDDEIYPDSSAESHLGVALLDLDDDTTSFSSVDQQSHYTFEDYLKGRCSRSSSFD